MAELFEVFPWGRWLPDLELWFVPMPNDRQLLDWEERGLRDLLEQNLRRNVLCEESCNSEPEKKHVLTCRRLLTSWNTIAGD
jgi:hypothetical protein